MNIAIVTDSTCDWKPEEYAARNVEMVPLKIQVDGKSFADQTEISTEEFYDRMIAADNLPTTSQPSPFDFAHVFERLAQQGFDAAVCLHIALPLSGTPQAAQIAANDAPLPVRVLDTRCATAELGLLVDRACELRESVTSLDELCDALTAFRDEERIVLVPETLDNLVRGGRFPEEAAKQAGMLNIRMLLTLDEAEGKVAPIGKAKGAKGVVKEIVAYAQHYVAEHGPARLRLVHCRNTKLVDSVLVALREAEVDFELTSIDSCGATIATHLGMGAIGVAFAPAARAE